MPSAVGVQMRVVHPLTALALLPFAGMKRILNFEGFANSNSEKHELMVEQGTQSSVLIWRVILILMSFVAPSSANAACCFCPGLGVTICGGITACSSCDGGVVQDSSGTHAVSIPSAEDQKLIHFDATLASGQVVNLRAVSGSMVKFSSKNSKEVAALIVVQDSKDNDAYSILRYKIRTTGSEELITPAGQAKVKINESAVYKFDGIEVVALRIVDVSSMKPENEPSVSSCCLSVAETRICSGVVLFNDRSCCALKNCKV